MGQIILASASPRRKELLEQIGISFEICPAKGEERITRYTPECRSCFWMRPERPVR